MRDRVRELRRVRASQLHAHPRNWRLHPTEQRTALTAAIAEIGFAGAVLARELPDGALELIDGHLRAESLGDELVPVLVLDLTDEEAEKLLLTHDPLAALATVDEEQLGLLLADIEFASTELADFAARFSQGLQVALAATGPTAAVARDDAVPNALRPEPTIPEAYQVVVQCRDEADQQAVYEQMREEGRRCRVLTLS